MIISVLVKKFKFKQKWFSIYFNILSRCMKFPIALAQFILFTHLPFLSSAMYHMINTDNIVLNDIQT